MALPPREKWEEALKARFTTTTGTWVRRHRYELPRELVKLDEIILIWNTWEFDQWTSWEKTFGEWDSPGGVDEDMQELPHEMITRLPNHAGLVENYGADHLRLRHSSDCLIRLSQMDKDSAWSKLTLAQIEIQRYYISGVHEPAPDNTEESEKHNRFGSLLLFTANNISSALHLIQPEAREHLTHDYRDGPGFSAAREARNEARIRAVPNE